jgi:tetratricopeptide (TPR) repeat protein
MTLCLTSTGAFAHNDNDETGAPIAVLGKLSFPTSTKSIAAQAAFEQGMLWLHLFEYPNAVEEFRKAEKLDPDFAMAYWGEALTHTHAIWNDDDREGAQKVLEKLGATPEARAAKAPTAREKAYLDAVEKLFAPGLLRERDTAFLKAMAAMATAYPKDDEAQLFYSLALLGVTRGDRDVPNYLHAAEIAKRVLAHNPKHPGAAHYWIHGMDDPEHAAGALVPARALSKIAPDAGHAQHMTSHIFIALGMWQDVIDANINGIRVVENSRKRSSTPMVHCGHYPEWLLYGYYQVGRQQDAQKLLMQCVNDTQAAEVWYRAHPDPKDTSGKRLAERIKGGHNSMVFMRGVAVIESENDRAQNAAIPIEVSDIGRDVWRLRRCQRLPGCIEIVGVASA